MHRTHSIIFELCMREKKERSGRTKSKLSCSIFSTVRGVNGTLGVCFTVRWLRVLSIRVLHSSAVVILELVLYLLHKTPI